MSPAYLIAAGRAEALMTLGPGLRDFGRRHAWQFLLEAPGLMILSEDGLAVERHGDGMGLVLGEAFDREQQDITRGRARMDSDRPCPAEALSAERFSTRFWGNYLHILAGERGSTVYRSAFGTLGAYFTGLGDVVLISSDATLLLNASGRPASIDWSALAQQLAWDNLADRTTPLRDVRELRGGEAMEIRSDGQWTIRPIWSAWDWFNPEWRLSDFDEAVDLVRREMVRSVEAYAQDGTCALVDLSGGLDSSILACLLARSGVPVTGFTVFAAGTEGDERRYARLVADHADIRLIEASPDCARVDVTRSHAAGLPRPYARSFVQEVDRLRFEAAAEVGAMRFFNGGGGDNVFCHLQSSAPAADVLRSFGPGRRFLQSVADVATAADCGFWEAARKSVAKSFRTARCRPWPYDDTLLHPDCLRTLVFTDQPPWPLPTGNLLPGQVEHAHALYSGVFNMNGFLPSPNLRGVFPMFSQPLIEACLRVSSWLWVEGGHDRAIARAAMKSHLPATIVARRSKGGLGSFQIALFERVRPSLRDMLIDGVLVSNGLVDRGKIEQASSLSSALGSTAFARLLRLGDAEAWAADWLGRT